MQECSSSLIDWIMKLWISYQPGTCDLRLDNIYSVPIQFIWFAQYNLALGSSDLYSFVVFQKLRLIGGDLVSVHHFDWLDNVALEPGTCYQRLDNEFCPDSIYLVCTVQVSLGSSDLYSFSEIGLSKV